MTFYVYPRVDFPMDPLYPNMIPLCVPSSDLSDISSSKIRQLLRQGDPVDRYLPPSIATYLTTYHLYLSKVSNN